MALTYNCPLYAHVVLRDSFIPPQITRYPLRLTASQVNYANYLKVALMRLGVMILLSRFKTTLREIFVVL